MTDEQKRQWISTLERLCFDVTSRDPLQAHKEYGTHRAVDVTLDESGQIRMVVTRQLGVTKNVKRKAQSGRVYKIFIEQNQVTIENYRLRDGDDLGMVLSEMEKQAPNINET
jgi:hypothetical protein